MTQAVEELKVRARLRLNAVRRAREAGDLRLRDCLHGAARAVGFLHWEHARRVLGGLAAAGDDMGTFWHAPRCSVLLNHWYADAARAREAHARTGGFLLPYRRQFVAVQDDFIRELGLDPADEAWSALRRDIVSGYGSPAWAALCMRRLRASAATFDAR